VEVRCYCSRMRADKSCTWSASSNGVGKALSSPTPVVVFGAEHFCKSWHKWVCYGAPVRDPLSAEMLAIVTVAGVAERARMN
jgi:sigma-54 dependent transcriptional regulator, acetoin dehydrogenase operon transcriptional activator AcoR